MTTSEACDTQTFPKSSAPHVALRVLCAAGMTIVLWASAFAGIRTGLVAYSPEQLALLRFLVASAVLACYALLTGSPQLRYAVRVNRSPV